MEFMKGMELHLKRKLKKMQSMFTSSAYTIWDFRRKIFLFSVDQWGRGPHPGSPEPITQGYLDSCQHTPPSSVWPETKSVSCASLQLSVLTILTRWPRLDALPLFYMANRMRSFHLLTDNSQPRQLSVNQMSLSKEPRCHTMISI